MMTQVGLNELALAINGMVQSCRIIVNGSVVEIVPHNMAVNGNKINLYFFVEESLEGNITKFELISKAGTVLASETSDISKTILSNLILQFSMTIS